MRIFGGLPFDMVCEFLCMPREDEDDEVADDFVCGVTQDCFLFIIAAANSMFVYMILLLSLPLLLNLLLKLRDLWGERGVGVVGGVFVNSEREVEGVNIYIAEVKAGIKLYLKCYVQWKQNI